MEAAALLEMTEALYFQKFVSLQYIITDDDSTMKANCKWSNVDWAHHHSKPVPPALGPNMQVGGKLKYPCSEPQFLADPAHRKQEDSLQSSVEVQN